MHALQMEAGEVIVSLKLTSAWSNLDWISHIADVYDFNFGAFVCVPMLYQMEIGG